MTKDIRKEFRCRLEQLMQQEHLDDSDYEKVEKDVYYSRGIRTICVLDPRFEEQIDMITTAFRQETADNALLLKQDYETLYGRVHIQRNHKQIIISMSDMNASESIQEIH